MHMMNILDGRDVRDKIRAYLSNIKLLGNAFEQDMC